MYEVTSAPDLSACIAFAQLALVQRVNKTIRLIPLVHRESYQMTL